MLVDSDIEDAFRPLPIKNLSRASITADPSTEVPSSLFAMKRTIKECGGRSVRGNITGKFLCNIKECFMCVSLKM